MTVRSPYFHFFVTDKQPEFLVCSGTFSLWKIQVTSFQSFKIRMRMLVRQTYYYLLINIIVFTYYLNILFMFCILRNMLVKLRMHEMSNSVRLMDLVQNSVSNQQQKKAAVKGNHKPSHFLHFSSIYNHQSTDITRYF